MNPFLISVSSQYKNIANFILPKEGDKNVKIKYIRNLKS